MSTTLRHPHYVIALALGLGMSADWLFYGRWPGISVPLFAGMCLAVLFGLSLIEQRWPTRANLWIGAAAFWFALCMALRSEPLLQFLDLATCLALLLLLVATYRGKPLLHMPLHHYMLYSAFTLFDLTWKPVPVAVESFTRFPVRGRHIAGLAPVGRGMLIATPVVACFTVLLMTADKLFASYVEQVIKFPIVFPYDILSTHTIVIGLVAWVCAGGLLIALTSDEQNGTKDPSPVDIPAEGDTRRLTLAETDKPLGCVEAMTVLTLVNLLFGSFLLIQAAYFFGGLDTLDRTGMTYAEYARRGFFELLAVACLSLALLWGLALLTRRTQVWLRLGFHASSALLVMLVLGLLASAFQRMLLYEQAYGFTRLRVYTHSFMLWLALVFLIFLVALLRERLRLFVTGGFLSALVYLTLLNLVNPDALIVRENIARYQQNGRIDTAYLIYLSDDAIPDLVATLDLLDTFDRERIQQHLDYQQTLLTKIAEQGGWPSWNRSRARALEALKRKTSETVQHTALGD